MKKITAISLALLMFFAASANALANARVVTLMYHEVTHDPQRQGDWGISPEQLEADINYFTERGYIPITAGELANESMNNLEGKKILLLTFDDGYADWYTEVYPILRRTGAKATMFIVGSYINRYGYLSEWQIHEMANCGLIEIGSHTDMIHQMPKDSLTNLYNSDGADDVIADIRKNTERLSTITGKDIVSISWPYGYYTDTLDWRVKNELGYKMSFSTATGVNDYSGDTSVVFDRITRDAVRTTEEIFADAEKRFQ